MKKRDQAAVNRRNVLMAAAAAALASGAVASAQTVTEWVGAPGVADSYTTATNWSNGVPTNTGNYVAQINNGGYATLNAGESGEAAFLHLGLTQTQSGTLEINGGTLNVGEMRIGGRYQIPDPANPGSFIANGGGTGYVLQKSGTVNVTYSPGTEPPVQSMYIGDGGLESGNTATGKYRIESGDLNNGLNSDDAIIVGSGAGSFGAFEQTGGNVSNTGFMNVARDGAKATYNMSGGTLFNAANLTIGEGHTTYTGTNATFTQSNGTINTGFFTSGTATLSGSLYVARRGGSGTYLMQGGTLAPNGDIWVGHAEGTTATTRGTFTQSAGAVNPGAVLGVGREGGFGEYTISGGTIKAGNINVGYGGTGTMTQSGSTQVTSTTSMAVGITTNTAGTGEYKLQSGTLTVEGTGNVLGIGVGAGGQGTFTQSGGRLIVGGTLQVGARSSGQLGVYNLEGGIASANQLYIGVESRGTANSNTLTGSGIVTQKAGTTLTVAGNFNLAGSTTSTVTSSTTGAYNMQGGLLTLSGTSAIWAIGNGPGSSGTFNQTGGTVAMTASPNGIDIGRNTGSGTYLLSNGVLNVSKVALASSANAGIVRRMAISGGTANITMFDFGSGSTSTALRTLSVSGGVANITALQSGNGVIDLSGGTPTINTLTLNGGGTLSSSINTDKIGSTALVVGNATVNTNGSLMTFTGNITNNARTLTKQGTGTLTISGAQTNTNATLQVDAGTVNMLSEAGSLTVTNSGTVNFRPPGVAAVNRSVTKLQGTGTYNVDPFVSLTTGSVRGGALNVANNGKVIVRKAGTNLVRVNTLNLNSNGTLDLNDNDLIVDNGNFQDIVAKRWQGYRDAPDSTATGIISSAGQTITGAPILAVFDNSVAGFGDWPFGSGNTVGNTAVLGQFTYIGDADLNGQVTPDDYGAIDSNLGQHVGTAEQSGGLNWLAGDWNFDGDITPDDYGGVDANLGNGQTQGPQLGASGLMAANGIAAVPEPASIGLLGVAGAGMLMRRRRGSRG
jgi:hypothetical protein